MAFPPSALGGPADPAGPSGIPGSAQAELAGLVNRFVARRIAFRLALAFALLHFAFASLRSLLRFALASPLHFSDRTKSNLEAPTPTGRRLYMYILYIYILYVYMYICIYVHIYVALSRVCRTQTL